MWHFHQLSKSKNTCLRAAKTFPFYPFYYSISPHINSPLWSEKQCNVYCPLEMGSEWRKRSGSKVVVEVGGLGVEFQCKEASFPFWATAGLAKLPTHRLGSRRPPSPSCGNPRNIRVLSVEGGRDMAGVFQGGAWATHGGTLQHGKLKKQPFLIFTYGVISIYKIEQMKTAKIKLKWATWTAC